VLDSFPKSTSAQEAMFRIGISFLELRYCTDAKTFLGETLKRYPKTTRAREIRDALATIQKNAKNRKVCSN
jgi:TolA-binding protein